MGLWRAVPPTTCNHTCGADGRRPWLHVDEWRTPLPQPAPPLLSPSVQAPAADGILVSPAELELPDAEVLAEMQKSYGGAGQC